MKDTHRFQIALPLFRAAIFVDWHGVLCNRLFWDSILSKRTHVLHEELKTKSELLFRSKKDLVKEWMRGNVRSVEILNEIRVNVPRRFKRGYLQRKLLSDCRKVRFDEELLNFLQRFRKTHFVVLATDNMDCFAETWNHVEGIVRGVDFVLCSSELGVLKSDGMQAFFGPWLEAHQLRFDQTILIDDSEGTCHDFREAGGSSILYDGLENLVPQLFRWEADHK